MRPMYLYKLMLLVQNKEKRYLHTEQQSCCLCTDLPVLFPNKLMQTQDNNQAGQCRDNNFVVRV